MLFWIITSLLALSVAVILVLTLLRGRPGGEPAAAYDLRVYRDQLKDVDRDLARGVIGDADADRIRAEVSRRILAADAQVEQDQAGSGQPQSLSLATAALLSVAVLGGSLAIYLAIGRPGESDLPLQLRIGMAEEMRTSRPGQDAAEARMPATPKPEVDANYAALLDQLRAKVAERPDDLQGQVLLARHEASTGNYRAAYRATARVLELMGDQAGADAYVEYAELQILAAGGYVSPEAETALRSALERDPVNGPARYYFGLMLAQIGRPDEAFVVWEKTLRHGPPDAPWIEPIRAQIGEMAWRAGVEYSPPAAEQAPPLAGPSQDDIAAAGEMSGADRQEMIRSMVDRLSDRLASEGGSVAEWGRLIGALGVLGETDRSRQAYEDARAAHASNSAALAQIDAAARKAGLIQ